MHYYNVLSRIFILGSLFVWISYLPCNSQELSVNDDIKLVERYKDDGTDRLIPLHPEMGDNRISDRLPSGSQAKIIELGTPSHSNWIRIQSGTVVGWIITKYVKEVLEPTSSSDPTITKYKIGTWNIEHYKNEKVRGFPEYLHNGPTYEPRSQSQIRDLAKTIEQDLDLKALMLNEINGTNGEDENGEVIYFSEELDNLLTELSSEWDYIITSSGYSQRVAFLYNSDFILVNEVLEISVPRREIQSKDIFARDPLAVHITLLEDGIDKNDLVIVGVHLAAGQTNHKNHDTAMNVLVSQLAMAQSSNILGGINEKDILILGDYNANYFLPPSEQFFISMDEPDSEWDVLVDNDYPATRMSGVPLSLETSQIDYIIASRYLPGCTGLSGEEIQDQSAHVHVELIGSGSNGTDNFRRDLSDHLPVTIDVLVMADND